MEFRDYYATLGVARDASDKEIKQAYRRLARKYHPDVNPGNADAESTFKAINEAHEVLGDADKRRKYDELGANWRQYEQAQQQGGSPFAWQTGPGGYHTINAEDMQDLFGGDSPFSDFFHTFFGGAAAGGTRARADRGSRGRRGRDVEQDLDLTLEQAFSGATRHLSIKHGGHTRSVDVRIPAGVAEGSRVRVAGEGTHGTGGGPAGDLYLRIRLRPDPRFERKDRDLYARVGLPVTVAALGGEADVPTVDGQPLRLRVPPTTQNGQVFRIRGRGMPKVGAPTERGDLYVTVDVRLPRKTDGRTTPVVRGTREAGGRGLTGRLRVDGP